MDVKVKELADEIKAKQDKMEEAIVKLREKNDTLANDVKGLTELEIEQINDKIDKWEKEYEQANDMIKKLTDDMNHKIEEKEQEKEQERKEEVFGKFVTKGAASLSKNERKYLQKAEDSGAYWVAPDWRSQLISELLNESKLRSRVTNLNTNSNQIEFPKDGTTINITWGGNSLPSSDEVSDEAIVIPVHTARALGLVTENMLADSAIDIENYIRLKLADAVSEEDDRVILSGKGQIEPRGITNADSGISKVTTSAAGTVTYDDVIDVIYDLHEKYASNATAIARRKVVREFRKLKDGSGRYLWEAPQGGEPATLDTIPLVQPYAGLDETISTGNTILLIGDLNYYYLINRLNMSLQRLDEKYLPNIGLYFRYRQGGKVVKANAFRKLEVS